MPSLADISAGQSATIVEILGEDSIAIRLMEMGLTEGETILFVGSAPLGDPIEVSIRGYRLSLRRAEAQRVQIQLSPAPSVSDSN
ncbi:FeoA family protein [Aureliella helgolandensis]|uniref:FeoA domain protein n=1 Tax=Aureliella helgolandensis TaxID=2527968 RepID=A0A518GFE5_9BACT|nr:ferrous iron transport protein A [Aureliella helgolandensis]QDV27278.1 FeoA domain protein [Aureliella helgolandensis]